MTTQKRPQNCGTSYCSCIECVMEPDYKALWEQMCERCDELDKKLAQSEQELDYKAIGQQAYESGYSTGYMDCAVKMKAQPEQSTTCGEPVAWIDDYNACKCPDNEARCFSDKVFRMMQKHTTPPQRKEPKHGWTPERIAGIARLKEAQDKKLAQPSGRVEQEPVAKVCHDLDGHIGWNPKLTQLPDEGTLLYTTPPQRNPLTREQRIQIVKDNTVQGYHGDYFDAWGIIDDVEAAHGIYAPTERKEKNT